MAKIYRLIDGYNLMYAAGMAREHYGPGDLERCRNQFISWLISQLTRHERQLATLVFDAEKAENSWTRKLQQAGLEIRYAPAGSDADTLIEELILEHSSPKQVHVISSDHRLHKAARRRKCRAIDSEDFLKWLSERELTGAPKHREAHRKPGYVPSEAEINHWLKEFGEIPEAGQIKSKSPSKPPTNLPSPKDSDKPGERLDEDWIRRLQQEIDFS